ncbi:hypothetical protein TIFTF001_037033 [Ficus carica]|uniref:Uncharacterized protein n=1 Tax=Ficus carica TaxID=3494 RepID=A0AA88E5E5_FICCA|nr:hypothetical protein TIFTF001_037023 [Ficus carica]GMN67973.1 hypothetical protein TIFTF001_037033 [Ficus carica]
MQKLRSDGHDNGNLKRRQRLCLGFRATTKLAGSKEVTTDEARSGNGVARKPRLGNPPPSPAPR